jgi:hypothetical protein
VAVYESFAFEKEADNRSNEKMLNESNHRRVVVHLCEKHLNLKKSTCCGNRCLHNVPIYLAAIIRDNTKDNSEVLPWLLVD